MARNLPGFEDVITSLGGLPIGRPRDIRPMEIVDSLVLPATASRLPAMVNDLPFGASNLPATGEAPPGTTPSPFGALEDRLPANITPAQLMRRYGKARRQSARLSPVQGRRPLQFLPVQAILSSLATIPAGLDPVQILAKSFANKLLGLGGNTNLNMFGVLR